MGKEKDRRNQSPEWDTIRTTIRTAEEAHKLIIESAKKQVLSLPWKNYGELKIPPGQAFDAAYGLILRNSKDINRFPINIADTQNLEDINLLHQLENPRKKPIGEGRYILITRYPDILPQSSTFTRDYLIIKTPEQIAALNNLDPKAVIENFAQKNRNFRSAGFRTVQALR